MASEHSQLIEDAGRLGVPLSDSQAQRALQLLDELSSWNRTYNLTAISMPSRSAYAARLSSRWARIMAARAVIAVRL